MPVLPLKLESTIADKLKSTVACHWSFSPQFYNLRSGCLVNQSSHLYHLARRLVCLIVTWLSGHLDNICSACSSTYLSIQAFCSAIQNLNLVVLSVLLSRLSDCLCSLFVYLPFIGHIEYLSTYLDCLPSCLRNLI